MAEYPGLAARLVDEAWEAFDFAGRTDLRGPIAAAIRGLAYRHWTAVELGDVAASVAADIPKSGPSS